MSFNKIAGCCAVAVAMFGANAASATRLPVAPTAKVIYDAGQKSVPSWTTASVFQTFDSSKLSLRPYTAQSGTLAAGGTWKETTSLNHVVIGDIVGAAPSKALAAIATYSVSFSIPQQYVSFVIAPSLAPANVSSLNLVLGFANGTTEKFTTLASLGETNLTKLLGGRVNFDMGGQSGITSFSIRGATIDDLASAAPEPATWGMMILGFGIAGGAMRRQRNTRKAVRFA